MNRRQGIVIGLTGGAGSGKSEVARVWKRLGAAVVAADAVGHACLNRPDVRRRLVRVFGDDILSAGGIDRSLLGRKAFASPARVRVLNRIMHPAMTKILWRDIAALRRGGRTVVLDAALLFEAGWDRLVDRTVVITSARNARISRLVERGLTPAQAAARLAAQWPDHRKAARADLVIRNAGSLARLRTAARRAWRVLLRTASPGLGSRLRG